MSNTLVWRRNAPVVEQSFIRNTSNYDDGILDASHNFWGANVTAELNNAGITEPVDDLVDHPLIYDYREDGLLARSNSGPSFLSLKKLLQRSGMPTGHIPTSIASSFLPRKKKASPLSMMPMKPPCCDASILTSLACRQHPDRLKLSTRPLQPTGRKPLPA